MNKNNPQTEKISLVASSSKTGLLPGTPKYTGSSKELFQIQIRIIKGSRITPPETLEISFLKEKIKELKKDEFVWISIIGMENMKIMAEIAKIFSIHSLFLEDIVNVHQRPKLIVDKDNLLFLVKGVSIDESNKILTSQVGIYLSDKVLLTVYERALPSLKIVEENIGMFLKTTETPGPDLLASLLLDQLVDNYFVLLEKLEDLIENLEDEVIYAPQSETLEKIQNLKKEILIVRRIMFATKELFARLLRLRPGIIGNEAIIYFDDIFDHLVSVFESVDNLREILIGLTELYMSSVSNKSNDIMMILTIIATIFIPHTFIVGVYGMNFTNMPELTWKYGYFALWVFLIILTILEIWYFKKKKWL